MAPTVTLYEGNSEEGFHDENNTDRVNEVFINVNTINEMLSGGGGVADAIALAVHETTHINQMSDKNEREEVGKNGINTSEENLEEHVDGVGKSNSDTIANNLIDELIDSEVKFNSDDIVAITKRPDGKIVWIENENEKAGLEHIYRHSEDFAKKGIEKDKIKSLIIQSL